MADLKQLAKDLAIATKETLSVVGGDAQVFQEDFAAELAIPLTEKADPKELVKSGLHIGLDIAILTGDVKAIKVMQDIEELGEDALAQKYGAAFVDLIKDIKDFKALAKK